MIWLLSDLHGRLDLPGWQNFVAKQEQDDILILLGDVEIQEAERENNQVFTETILSSKKPIWIVDGNHENFEFICRQPEIAWNGGMVHCLSDTVLHLQRGYIYNLFGLSCFVFGGTAATITEEEINRAYESLKQCDYSVDYILTHDYYKSRTPGHESAFEKLMDFIDTQVTFRQWYCGHHHRNQALDDLHTIVYDQLISISPVQE